jgi:hypothetical protein
MAEENSHEIFLESRRADATQINIINAKLLSDGKETILPFSISHLYTPSQPENVTTATPEPLTDPDALAQLNLALLAVRLAETGSLPEEAMETLRRGLSANGDLTVEISVNPVSDTSISPTITVEISPQK